MLHLMPNVDFIFGSAKYLEHMSSVTVRMFPVKAMFQFIHWRNFRNQTANPSLTVRQINTNQNTWGSLFTLAEHHASRKGLFVFLIVRSKPE